MVQNEQKTLEDTVSSQHKYHQNSKNTFFILRIRRHLVTQFSVANGNKENSQVCRTVYESFIRFLSITKTLYKF
jgi:hypothetical protein